MRVWDGLTDTFCSHAFISCWCWCRGGFTFYNRTEVGGQFIYLLHYLVWISKIAAKIHKPASILITDRSIDWELKEARSSEYSPTTHCFNINIALSQAEEAILVELGVTPFDEQLLELPFLLGLVGITILVDVEAHCFLLQVKQVPGLVSSNLEQQRRRWLLWLPRFSVCCM